MFRLHLTYPSGTVVTLSFPSAFLRGLHVIMLTAQPVTLRPIDPAGMYS